MAKLNRKTNPDPIHTHEGGRAKRVNTEAQLRRITQACMLWEDQFYVDGKTVAGQIETLVGDLINQNNADAVVLAAVEAREINKLRHVPLLIAAIYASKVSGDSRVSVLIENVVRRADELAEFLAIYANVIGVSPKELRQRIPAQVKKGLAAAFTKFDEYQLAKYNRKADITLTDVLRLVHPDPKAENADARARLAAGTLRTPDTWETNLSAGADKRETFTRLIKDGKLGYMALLRNLRNMDSAGVDHSLIKDALVARKGAHNVLPFRYIAAVRHAPWAADALDEAMIASIDDLPQFSGETVLLLDHSGSMTSNISGKGDMSRADAAGALAGLFPGRKRVFSFSSGGWDSNKLNDAAISRLKEHPSYKGLAMVSNFIENAKWGGTNLGAAIRAVGKATPNADRLIVLTDEQAHDRVGKGHTGNNYMINVAAYRNGVGYGDWLHIDGWSENVFRYIHAYENTD